MSRRISFALRYPAMARQLGQRGTAQVRVSVRRNGMIVAAPLLRSSGHAALDEEAQAVMLRVRRFDPVPAASCVGADIVVVDQPVVFAGLR